MSTQLTHLFSAFDRGLLSRRQLLQALGVAAVIRPISAYQSYHTTTPNGFDLQISNVIKRD